MTTRHFFILNLFHFRVVIILINCINTVLKIGNSVKTHLTASTQREQEDLCNYQML